MTIKYKEKDSLKIKLFFVYIKKTKPTTQNSSTRVCE